MRWPNLSTLRGPAGEDGAEGGGGDEKKVSTKTKIGDNEYENKDLESSISLYKALQDPETGKEIIETLARKAGLLDKEGDVKVKPNETQKQAESRVAKALKAKLGKDYEKFADSVGPAFDEIIEDMLNERLGARDQQNTAKTWSDAVDKFNDSYELTPDIEEAMQEIMAEAPPNFKSDKFNPQRYLTRIYKNAVEELGAAIKPKKGTSRSTRSSTRGNDDELPEIIVRDAPKNVSIDDAVEAAMKGIRFRRKS